MLATPCQALHEVPGAVRWGTCHTADLRSEEGQTPTQYHLSWYGHFWKCQQAPKRLISAGDVEQALRGARERHNRGSGVGAWDVCCELGTKGSKWRERKLDRSR